MSKILIKEQGNIKRTDTQKEKHDEEELKRMKELKRNEQTMKQTVRKQENRKTNKCNKE